MPAEDGHGAAEDGLLEHLAGGEQRGGGDGCQRGKDMLFVYPRMTRMISR